MSSTKQRLGRDPELHQIHTTVAEANAYKGHRGEITLVQDATGALFQLRAHDGVQVGGFVAALAAASSPAGMAPNSVAVPPIERVTAAANEEVAINHGLGYQPVVVVTSAAGAAVAVTVVHNDADNVTITIPTAGTYTIQLR